MDSPNQRLGAFVKRRRLELGFSLRGFCREADIAAPSLSMIEKGTHLPKLPRLLELCRVLRVHPLAALVTGWPDVEWVTGAADGDVLEALVRAKARQDPDWGRRLGEQLIGD